MAFALTRGINAEESDTSGRVMLRSPRTNLTFGEQRQDTIYTARESESRNVLLSVSFISDEDLRSDREEYLYILSKSIVSTACVIDYRSTRAEHSAACVVNLGAIRVTGRVPRSGERAFLICLARKGEKLPFANMIAPAIAHKK